MTRRGRGLPIRIADAISDPFAWEQTRKLERIPRMPTTEQIRAQMLDRLKQLKLQRRHTIDLDEWR